MKQPPPFPQKTFRHLPSRDIPGRRPCNDAASLDLVVWKALVQTADAVSPQLVLVKSASGPDQAVSSLGTREQVDPVAVRHRLLKGGWQECRRD